MRTTIPATATSFPPRRPDGLLPSCAEAGILGALTGVIGSIQAMEVLKLVAGIGEPLVGGCSSMTGSRSASRRSATESRKNAERTFLSRRGRPAVTRGSWSDSKQALHLFPI